MRYRWDDFELDVLARRLCGPSGDIHVEPQVFDVLLLLIEKRDRIVPKEELLDEVWGDQFVSESAVTTRIKDARRALGDDGRAQRFIRNVHGRGYQFVGELADGTFKEATQATSHFALDITVDDEFPFVGRVDELAAINTFLVETGRRASEVFIAGAPGVGKSRLAVELLERSAELGYTVCASRCDEQVRSALQPVRDCFAQLAAAHPDRVAQWSEGFEGALNSLIPSLMAYMPHPPVSIDTYAAIDTFLNVFDRVVADAPLMLLIDDIQWSDEPTRGFLSRLQRRLADRPIATICTNRSGAADLPLDVDSWIRSQSNAGPVRSITLADLGQQDAQQLAQAVLGDNHQAVATVASSTAGNCLFLTESLRELQQGQEAGGSVSELVSARVARQSDDVQVLIRAAALLGPEFAFATAAAASGLEPARALTAIGEAVATELLHETASAARFRFSHQLVPESIAQTMGRQARAVVHASCAEALRAVDGDEIEIALHTIRSVPLVTIDAAVQLGRETARKAVQDKEFDRAVPVLRQVLELGVTVRTRAEVLLAIGETIVARGTPQEALPYFEEVAGLARRNGWPDLLADAALGHWGRSPFRRPDDTSTLELLAEAEAALGPEESLRKARVLAKSAAFSIFAVSMEARRVQLEAALALVPDATGLDRMELLESQAIAFTSPAGIDDLDTIDPELERIRVTHSTYFADAATPETRLLMRGLGAELREVIEFDELRSRAQPIGEWRDAVLSSTLATFRGSFEEAEALCNLGGSIGERFWGESSLALHAVGLLFIDSVSGQWGRSREALQLLVDAGDVQVLVPSLAWALAEQGRMAKSRQALTRLKPVNLQRFGEHIIGGNALIAYGETALLLDDDDLAAAAEQALLPFEDIVLGVPWACSFAAADTLSRLAERRDDHGAAEKQADRARALYTTLDAPALLARLDRN